MIGSFSLMIRSLGDDKLAGHHLEQFFEAMVRFNESFLVKHPNTPLLYSSGVRYRREAPEIWKDIPTTLRDGWDDCEGLSSWLAAEMRVRFARPNATVKLVLQPTIDRKLWHAIVVDLDTGEKFDPSKQLGMKGKA